jgi:O-antigen/teichoic acid export membrane protein
MSAVAEPSLRRRVAGQGALLMSGFVVAQACSFARNAILAHALAKGDFGIAAALALVLQLLETLSDLGPDRLIVQAADGDDPALMRSAHATLLVRGLATALLLYLAAHPIAAFFHVPEAAAAFELAALVPLVKGFLHLDSRRRQRALDNRPFMIVEAAPQVAALALTLPVLAWSGGYVAVVWLALLQAGLTVIASHTLAERPYGLTPDAALVRRILAFGWPIWLSAFPLVAVYQGDRLIAGRLLGIEALAGYAAAFMMTMVPGLIAAKVGHALILPLLAECRAERDVFLVRARLTMQMTALAAAVYLALFLIAGGKILPLAFGANYAGYGAVVGWLALMWALRMVQAVPGLALMAHGDNRPLLIAGLLRAAALLPAAVAVQELASLEALAAAGVAGEAASLAYILWRADRTVARLARELLTPLLWLAPFGVLALAVALAAPLGKGTIALTLAAALTALAIGAGGVLVLRELRALAMVATRRLLGTPAAHN